MRAAGSRKKSNQVASKKDNVFTKRSVAEEIVALLTTKFSHFLIPEMHAIEPSAGDGAFVESLSKYFASLDAMDIDPKSDAVKKQDFFKYSPIRPPEQCVCVGNPPFSIVQKFLVHCTRIAHHIVMILPQRYYQALPVNTFDKHWRVEYKALLPTTGDESPFYKREKINTTLLYLRRDLNYERAPRVRMHPNGFKIVTYQGTQQVQQAEEKPDLLFWQAGPKAGKRARYEDLGNGMAYGLLFHDREKLARIQHEDSVEIEVIKGTNGLPYITSTQISKVINEK